MELIEFLDKGGRLIGLIRLELREIIVDLKGGIANLNDAYADVGAVIGNPFAVGENVGEHQTGADGAFAILKPADVPVANLSGEIVDDLLQGLHMTGETIIVCLEGVHGQLQNFR